MATVLATVFHSNDGDATSFLGGLYKSPDLADTMGNIATGMSYSMLSGPNATQEFGEVLAVQTYIRVRWAWLSLLTVLVSSGGFILVAVIVSTTKARQRAWKSALGPLLYDEDALLHGAPGLGWTAEKREERAIAIIGILHRQVK